MFHHKAGPPKRAAISYDIKIFQHGTPYINNWESLKVI